MHVASHGASHVASPAVHVASHVASHGASHVASPAVHVASHVASPAVHASRSANKKHILQLFCKHILC